MPFINNISNIKINKTIKESLKEGSLQDALAKFRKSSTIQNALRKSRDQTNSSRSHRASELNDSKISVNII